MKKNLFFFAFAILCSIASSNADAQISVNVANAGGLSAAIKAQQSNLTLVTNLTVSGAIDARDFRFVRDTLKQLVSLNLSGATIAAYSGVNGTNCNQTANAAIDIQTAYAANEIPPFAFFKHWITGSVINYVRHEENLPLLATLVLPATATQIGDYALAGLSALTSLNLASLTNVTAIGERALFKSGLTTVTFPEGLQTLGSNVLTLNTNLQTVNFPASLLSIGNTSGFFEFCTALQSVNFAEPAHITVFPLRFLYSNPSETSMQLPALQTFTLPSSVTDISTAFENFIGVAINCHADNAVYKSIDGVLYKKADNSFVALAKGITSFTVPSEMTAIPNDMFRNCKNLSTINIQGNLTKIGNYAFYNVPITSFNFQNTLTEIGEYAFSETNLIAVNFTDNAALKTVKNNVFSHCALLTTANLTGLDTLGISMFQTCSALTNVTFNPTLKKISSQAFNGCVNLESIVIPNSVTSIGSSAFQSCPKLASVNLPASLISLGELCFNSDTLISTFALPASFNNFIASANSGTPFTGTFADVTADAANPNFSAENGILFNKNKTKVFYIPTSRTRKSIVIPNGVEIIANSAFRPNSGIRFQKITLPASLRMIENYGIAGAANADTLQVKAFTPPSIENNFNSLSNRFTANHPVVQIPAKTKNAYKSAPGWLYYYDPTGAYAGTPYDVLVQQSAFFDLQFGMPNAVSPNGKLVVGDGANGGYLFDVQNETQTLIPDAFSAIDINDKGFVAGNFYDNNYIFNGSPIRNSGVYRNGQWYSLGLGRYGNVALSAEVTTDVSTIDSTGNVYGASYLYQSLSKVTPFVWKYNAQNNDYKTDTMAYASPVNYLASDQGGKIRSISSNGQIAAGWISRHIYGGARSAIGWTSPTDYKLFDTQNWSESAGVSPNGKYITCYVGGRAAIYFVETDSILVFGPENSRPTAVSDNGFVIGFRQRGDTFESGREGFVWSERMGLMYMREFIDKYTPDAQIPAGDFFNFPKNVAIFDVPMDISADGLVITGWSGYSALATRGWLLCLPDTLSLIDRPHNLKANVNEQARNVVALDWAAPTGFGTHTLDFFYIYRNDEHIGRIEGWEYEEGMRFTDSNAPTGKMIYEISAIFDWQNTNNYLESGRTDPATVMIVDNYNIPFRENFENAFNKNYWNEQGNQTSAWILVDAYGFDSHKGALFIGAGNGERYDFSLTSKPFHPAGTQNVTLSYLWRVLTDAETFVGRRDTVYIEVGNGNNWTKLQTVIINQSYDWTPVTVDITNIVDNQLFKVRFRAKSGDNRNAYNFIVDDFGVSDGSSQISMEDVIALKFPDENVTHVYYPDTYGAYALTHQTGDITITVSNEGTPFLVANRFAYKDTKAFENKYITSVSAFIAGDYLGTQPTQLKIAIFENGMRINSDVVSSFTGNDWNTFKLSQPIQVNPANEYMVGLEVVYHDAKNAPIVMDNANDSAFAKSKLLSYDGGLTWSSASLENYYELKPDQYGVLKPVWTRFNGNWAIIANVRNENVASPIDDDIYIIAYSVYYNDQMLKLLHKGQHFIDTTGIEDRCYRVSAFNALGGMSPLSDAGCVQIVTNLKHNALSRITVYPNPAKDFIVVDGEFEKVKIIDITGKTVYEGKTDKINVSGFARGVYLLEITDKNGKTGGKQVILE
jgi:hypothetical protein